MTENYRPHQHSITIYKALGFFFLLFELWLASNTFLWPLMWLVRVVRGNWLGHHSILCFLLFHIGFGPWIRIYGGWTLGIHMYTSISFNSGDAEMEVAQLRHPAYALSVFFKCCMEFWVKFINRNVTKLQIKRDSYEYYRNYIYVPPWSNVGFFLSSSNVICEAKELWCCWKLV